MAIDARHQDRPRETRFRYVPFAALEDEYRFTPETRERVIRDYYIKDLAI
ncbi:MAG: hypothetical protein IPK81_00555 [Rhodospirillales bacterium]|nr:MAG: hypothetical protein IPK81_00555 [Rhodospirillales bacterium]